MFGLSSTPLPPKSLTLPSHSSSKHPKPHRSLSPHHTHQQQPPYSQHIPHPHQATHQSPPFWTPKTSPNPPRMSFASPHLSSPPCANPPTSTDRLETLITQIQGVLRAYTALPVQNPVHIASLKDFLRKAVELGPEHSGYEFGGSPSSDGDEILTLGSMERRQYGSVGPYDRGVGQSPSSAGVRGLGKLRGTSENTAVQQEETQSQREPDMVAVSKLERAWWSSEVVAAWYGPRPGCHTPNERAKARKESEREAITRRFASLIGLDDDD